MIMEEVDVLVLGAGVAGLGAALKAREIGRQVTVFEARNSAGGLLDNFEVEGFRFDHAVHLSFANEEKVRAIFDKTPYLTHPADSLCFEAQRWLKHPVQNNLFPLPAEQKVELIESFLARPEAKNVDNYENWLRHQYGDAISERYPLRYTRKYWGVDASELTTAWIGNRMRRAELSEILYGAFTSDTPNTYYTKEMRYPEKGGFKSFIQSLIDASDIRLNHVAVAIDAQEKTVRFSNGSVVRFRNLITTLPLPILVTLVKDVRADILAAASTLKATSIDLVSVGFNKPLVKDLWFYIYDDDILASRAYSPSVKSPTNAPEGCSSLQFEIYSLGPESKYQPQELIENTTLALRKMGIADQCDTVFMDHRRIKYGNVVFLPGMEQNRDRVREYMSENGVVTCGRFGQWDYLWSNQSLLSGYSSVN